MRSYIDIIDITETLLESIRKLDQTNPQNVEKESVPEAIAAY
jgi:HD-like signal output (HDOD) protein